MQHTRTHRWVIAATLTTSLIGLMAAPAYARPGITGNHDNVQAKVTTTALGADSTSITTGDTVTLSGGVTWDDDGTPTGVKDGTVEVKRSDGTCAAATAFATTVGSESFDNDDADTGAQFSVTDTPAAGTYAYKAFYGGGVHGGPVTYSTSESSCVEVTVTDPGELRDAPAWANEYMRTDGRFDAAECEANHGRQYHGKVATHIAQTFEGESYATYEDAEDAGVFEAVDTFCASS